MIATIRTTTGRENVVIETIVARVKTRKLPIKAVFHPEEFRGYVFIEGDANDIEASIKGIPHIRGLINKDVPLGELERFLIEEKREVKVEVGDIIEIIGGPFKGEKGKITRVDNTKNDVVIEFLEAAIPIPVTISTNSVRICEKKK